MIDNRFCNRLQDNGRRFYPTQDQRLSSITETAKMYFKRGGVAHIKNHRELAICGGITGVAVEARFANCIHCFRVRKLRREGKAITSKDCGVFA